MEKTLYPLSRQQMEILTYDLTYPKTNINTVSGFIRLEKPYANDIITQIIRILVSHEQSLRLRITEKDGQYFQYEMDYYESGIQIINKKVESIEDLEEIHQQDAGYAFQWKDNPLCFFTITRLGDTVYVGVTAHHSIADGYSMVQIGKLVNDYSELLVNNQLPQLVEHRYTDHVERQQKAIKSLRYKKDCAYWRDMFTNWDGICCIKPGAKQTNSATSEQITKQLDNDFTKSLISLCREMSISPAVPFMGAIALYLYSINPDKKRVDIGILKHNRSIASDKKTIGMFAKDALLTLNIHTYIQNEACAFLKEVQKEVLKTYYHGLCSLSEITTIAKNLNPDIDKVRDVEFIYLPFLHNADCEIGYTHNGKSETSADFMLWQVGKEENMTFMMDYRIDVFCVKEAEKVYDDIMEIVEEMVVD